MESPPTGGSCYASRCPPRVANDNVVRSVIGPDLPPLLLDSEHMISPPRHPPRFTSPTSIPSIESPSLGTLHLRVPSFLAARYDLNNRYGRSRANAARPFVDLSHSPKVRGTPRFSFEMGRSQVRASVSPSPRSHWCSRTQAGMNLVWIFQPTSQRFSR